MIELSRPQPLMDAAAYKTYEMRSPLATHFRPATCAEVDCPYYLNGWQVHVESLAENVLYAVQHSGRKYTVQKVADGETYLKFEPGQMCFRHKLHRKREDRPPLYVVRDGDHRGNPTGRGRQHTSPEDWIDDFATHQQAIADEIKKG